MAMIEFKNVEKYYGKFHALKNINLEFEKVRSLLLSDLQDLVKVQCSVRLMV